MYVCVNHTQSKTSNGFEISLKHLSLVAEKNVATHHFQGFVCVSIFVYRQIPGHNFHCVLLAQFLKSSLGLLSFPKCVFVIEDC